MWMIRDAHETDRQQRWHSVQMRKQLLLKNMAELQQGDARGKLHEKLAR